MAGLPRPDDEVRVAITVEVPCRRDTGPEPSRATGRRIDDEIGHRVHGRATEVEIRPPDAADLRIAERSDQDIVVAISVHVADPGYRGAEEVRVVLTRRIDEEPGRDRRRAGCMCPRQDDDREEKSDDELRVRPYARRGRGARAMHGGTSELNKGGVESPRNGQSLAGALA